MRGFLNKIFPFLKGGQHSEQNLTIYRALLNMEDQTFIIYAGSNWHWALSEYRHFTIQDMESDYMDRNDLCVVLEKQINKYFFIGDGSVEEYPVKRYYDDTSVYELVEEGEIQTMRSRELEPINTASNKILRLVNQHYKTKYGKYRSNIIYIYDKDDDIRSCIQLVISDHTEIPTNERMKICEYRIMVVIANLDRNEHITPSKRKGEFFLRYDETTNPKTIIKTIDELIKSVSSDY